ncbi:hypothetical protein [Methanoculleus horonobensis]|uniref:hypothetical protein n=1 Tax=Methanoculleus horonobensis TaxID=528314 RepID=UPI0008321DA7|nr:hypothetical protein [Methanoculleus horonobensis]MDD3070016.1 hypothetical protein [Methanoculleus horonobensis]
MGNHAKTLRNLLIAAGILAAVLLVIVALIAANLGQSASESFRSTYHYELKVSTSGPIEDAVLLIPLPSRYDPATGTNVTPINLSRASLRNFDSDISVKIENVDGVPMLNISADRIDPIYKNRITPIPIMPGQNESELPKPTQIYSDRYSEETPVLVDRELHLHDADPGREIETRMPIGTEPLLAPYRIVGNLTGSDDHLSPGSSGYVVEVPFIFSFEAADDNVLTISADLQGRNEWWVMGWQFNSYHEQVRHEFTGPCNGTYLVKGVLVTGEGVY